MVSMKEGVIDYEEVRRIAKECRPKLIIAGASAYARIIDFKKFREIADEVGAYLMVDMAHIAGLVAAGLHPSPIPYAHVTTTTTHKTLRGPRGGMILSSNEMNEKFNFNKAIFPGIQGGPLMHVIAAKAVCFKEALSPDFVDISRADPEKCESIVQWIIRARCEDCIRWNGQPFDAGGSDWNQCQRKRTGKASGSGSYHLQ